MDDMDTVCDICGDQGIEEYLAICNKCPDGAEHIYCNDDKLDKLPEGDWWICEDCRKSPGPLLKSEFNGQLAKVPYLPKQKVEKNIAIHDTRKRKNLGLMSKSVSFDNASSSVKLNGKCSEVVVANDSASTPVSNSLKRKVRDMVGAHEIGEFDAMDTRSSGDRILLGGDNYNSGCSDSRQSLDGKKQTPEDGPCISVGNVGNKPSKDVKGKMPMEENNNADNGKLPMEEKNNADRLESSRQSSLSVASPTSYEENMDLLYWHAVETLTTLLWIKQNLI